MPRPEVVYPNSKAARMPQNLDRELIGQAPSCQYSEAFASMFELIALWMIVGLFYAGFWLVVSASWA